MSRKSFIDSIGVKTPCSEDWNEMKGTDTTRFCSHCSKHVNDISALTRKQAMRLVRASNGGICIRYIKNPKTNAPVFAGKLYQITRRAGITAGVLGASLSLSTMTYAQGEAVNVNIKQTITIKQPLIESRDEIQSNKDNTEKTTGSVSGTITDPNGAVFPNITVTISGNGYTMTAATSEDGFYKFENLPAGKYELSAEAVNFKKTTKQITITEGAETNADISLDVNLPVETVFVGGGGYVEYKNPLVLAVSNDDLEEVRNLIANGENVNGRDENYSDITPLFLAVENGNVEMVETLLNFGAKVNARDKNKQTPLMRLDEDANAELVRILIKHGAKINLIDNEGNTALILAARSVNSEVLQILIDHDASVNAQNKQRQTALMNAADADNLENVRALILAGADVNLKNKDDESAWDLTASDEIEELLVSHGAIIDDN